MYHECARKTPTCRGLKQGVKGYHLCARSKHCRKGDIKPKKITTTALKSVVLKKTIQNPKWESLKWGVIDANKRTIEKSLKVFYVKKDILKDTKKLKQIIQKNININKTLFSGDVLKTKMKKIGMAKTVLLSLKIKDNAIVLK